MLGDDIAAALPELRAQAESLMTDTCTITVPGTGEPTWDPVHNVSVPPEPTVIYPRPDTTDDGRCRIQLTQLSSDKPLVGVDQMTVVQHVLSIPFGTAQVPKAATVTITAVGALGDPAMVGDRFTVRSSLHKSQATAYRFQVDQVQPEAS